MQSRWNNEKEAGKDRYDGDLLRLLCLFKYKASFNGADLILLTIR